MLPQLFALGCAQEPHGLGRPNRLALGDGVVYVSDFQHDRIAVYREDGTFVKAFGHEGLGRGELWRVTAMATDDDGSLLVANRRPASDAEDSVDMVEIKRFVDGRETEVVDLGGKVLREDAWIDAVAPMGDGRWLVADSSNGELVVVEQDRLVGRFGGIPRSDAAPTALAREGHLFWQVEQLRHRVTPLDAHGQELPFEPSVELRFPSAVAVCPDERAGPSGGWVAIADLGHLRVVRLSTEGALLNTFSPEPVARDRPVQMLDLALSEDCQRLYIVDSKGDRVLITDPFGAPLGELGSW